MEIVAVITERKRSDDREIPVRLQRNAESPNQAKCDKRHPTVRTGERRRSRRTTLTRRISPSHKAFTARWPLCAIAVAATGCFDVTTVATPNGNTDFR
ncbi:hypothetical protein GCM10009533_50160 [Saccharopolyspora spinosporotrichia]|uniref:Uncharacterized protein n=1 Tax=Saccharopolyspora erythraea TaxID=1836 RepID=A0ABN1DKH9_SACER